ncbi:MAG: biopolymer transporter ExbD [Verrucomicrobia bacterium]|nr:biopolymer transporter ExbD [Cytophagales bacterium]
MNKIKIPLLLILWGIVGFGIFYLCIALLSLASTFQKPKTMQVSVPEHETFITTDTTNLTVIIGAGNNVFHHTDKAEIHKTDFKGIHEVLITEKNENPDLGVIIKYSPDAKFKNLVDMLDQMAKCGIKKYAMVDFEEKDALLIKNAK